MFVVDLVWGCFWFCCRATASDLLCRLSVVFDDIGGDEKGEPNCAEC